jgi:hypothetical protein
MPTAAHPLTPANGLGRALSPGLHAGIESEKARNAALVGRAGTETGAELPLALGAGPIAAINAAATSADPRTAGSILNHRASYYKISLAVANSRSRKRMQDVTFAACGSFVSRGDG